MFIELIDALRCVVPHEETWLVAAFTQLRDRFVVEGRLGCPTCGASYAIRGGVADMRDAREMNLAPGPAISRKAAAVTDEDPVRFAAMLAITRPGSLIAIEGEAAAAARDISELADARVIALNPSGNIDETERVATVLSTARIPLAASSLDGIVLAAETRLDIEECSRTLRPGGRLVLPSSMRPGGRFRELARDDRHVVAESHGELVRLGR